MRTTYWSCTKLANRIRGKKKPLAATSEDWDVWHKEAKQAHPIRYWIAEEALDKVQAFIWWPVDKIYSVKYYINNRWVSRAHALTAHPRDIKPGQWQDLGYRFLPCLFNELVNFVECELAWMQIAWGDKKDRAKYDAPFWATGWLRWHSWRCPQAGLDNLEWQRQIVWKAEEIGEDNPEVGKRTDQAEKADEILALYKWWTEVYPNRPDPHEASGWSVYCALSREKNGGSLGSLMSNQSEDLQIIGEEAIAKLREIEESYWKEDEEMMIRLIRIRNHLWT